MLIEEAVGLIKNELECVNRNDEENCNRMCSDCDLVRGVAEIKQAYQMAISALEKQIPKKPILINKNKEFDGNWKKICPLCKSTLIERITTPEVSYPIRYNYTLHCKCGQAIDWEDGEG